MARERSQPDDGNLLTISALARQVRVLQRQREDVDERLRVASELIHGVAERSIRGTAFTKASWTAMFRAIGLDDDAMLRWHRQFEETNPEDHKAFLRSLGLDAAEVQRIRRRSRR
ncbi:MAG: hypothetical protein JNM76_12560 [Betaproteobacteria bacterium]|nr:hypothetical protein [Betaproteobacteria bacterium]